MSKKTVSNNDDLDDLVAQIEGVKVGQQNSGKAKKKNKAVNGISKPKAEVNGNDKDKEVNGVVNNHENHDEEKNGDHDKAKKKRNRNKNKKKGEDGGDEAQELRPKGPLKQTDPPRVAICDLFPDGQFPKGEQ